MQTCTFMRLISLGVETDSTSPTDGAAAVPKSLDKSILGNGGTGARRNTPRLTNCINNYNLTVHSLKFNAKLGNTCGSNRFELNT